MSWRAPFGAIRYGLSKLKFREADLKPLKPNPSVGESIISGKRRKEHKYIDRGVHTRRTESSASSRRSTCRRQAGDGDFLGGLRILLEQESGRFNAFRNCYRDPFFNLLQRRPDSKNLGNFNLIRVFFTPYDSIFFFSMITFHKEKFWDSAIWAVSDRTLLLGHPLTEANRTQFYQFGHTTCVTKQTSEVD